MIDTITILPLPIKQFYNKYLLWGVWHLLLICATKSHRKAKRRYRCGSNRHRKMQDLKIHFLELYERSSFKKTQSKTTKEERPDFENEYYDSIRRERT